MSVVDVKLCQEPICPSDKSAPNNTLDSRAWVTSISAEPFHASLITGQAFNRSTMSPAQVLVTRHPCDSISYAPAVRERASAAGQDGIRAMMYSACLQQ